MMTSEGLEVSKIRRDVVTAGLFTLVAGVAVDATLWMSLMSRYFWVEDSGIDESSQAFRQLVSINPTERGILYFGLAFMILGIGLILARGVISRKYGAATD